MHTGGVWVYGNTDGVVDETAAPSPPAITAWRGDNERGILQRARSGGHRVLVMPAVVYGHGPSPHLRPASRVVEHDEGCDPADWVYPCLGWLGMVAALYGFRNSIRWTVDSVAM